MTARKQQSQVAGKSSGFGPALLTALAVGLIIAGSLWWLSPIFQNCFATGDQSIDLAGRPLWLFCAIEAIDENDDLTIALATIVLAVFTISLWAATNQLRRSTDQLWEADREAMVTSNRAWVFAQPWPGAVDFHSDRDTADRDIDINAIELKHYGTSPVTVTELHVAFSDKEPQSDTATFPGETIKQIYNLAPGNRWQHAQKFTTTDAKPFVYGYVRYVDAFGVERESRYCYRITRDGPGFRTAGGPTWSSFT